jgi:hypothetical protein
LLGTIHGEKRRNTRDWFFIEQEIGLLQIKEAQFKKRK